MPATEVDAEAHCCREALPDSARDGADALHQPPVQAADGEHESGVKGDSEAGDPPLAPQPQLDTDSLLIFYGSDCSGIETPLMGLGAVDGPRLARNDLHTI